mgnify:CR=1 FL=1
MKAKTARIINLLEKYVRGTLTPDEQQELEAWAAASEQNRTQFRELTNKATLLRRLQEYGKADSASMWQKTMQKISAGAPAVELPRRQPVWLRKAVAAAAILIITAGALSILYYKMSRDASGKLVQTEQTDPPATAPLYGVPGGDKSVLILADGSKIELEKAPDGKLTQQGSIEVSKTAGHLSYTGRFVLNDRVSTRSAAYDSLLNMVSTPRGGQYAITLPDGSKVWLNAASSLRFPLAFAGKQRTVELTGEAYFEVTPLSRPDETGQSSKVPFIVKLVSADRKQHLGEIEVLGTQFNVAAYAEDKNVRTTLVEGYVRFKNGNASKLLKPGQQAIDKNGTITVQKADIDKALAWKNGRLTLSGSTIEVMNQLARWYNVEVEYRGSIPQQIENEGIEGTVPRDSDLKTVTEVLNQFNLHIKHEHNKIIVTP